jgi:hypothetical protein
MRVRVISPVTPQDNAQPSAFMAGHAARRKGISVIDCPHDLVTDLMKHAAWCAGWIEADQEMGRVLR